MRYRLNVCVTALVGVVVAVAAAGCETCSHKSVRIYEYTDEPRPAEISNDEPTSEYRMESPGEMIPPGNMVRDR